MVHRSMENLKFDKRLASRRGWVSDEERSQTLEGLPDVAEKGEEIRIETPETAGEPSGDTPEE